MRIDPTGKWDVSIHLYENRQLNGYGIAVVTDRWGNEVYRFNVRAEGIGGRDRLKNDSDTPLGVYDIPQKNMWKRLNTIEDREQYGPNYRLILNGESGEISDS